MSANEAEWRRWSDDAWERSWPERERLTDAVTPLLLEALAPQPGERLLEVGCGGGKVAVASGHRVGPEGGVTGVDISAPMLRLAARRAREGGAANLRFEHADAQTAEIAGGPFDAALSQFGVMFFDEPVAAFTNIRRHLRSPGRLAFACWEAAARNPWFTGPALAHLVPPPAPPAPGKSATGPFSLGDVQRTTEILVSAGFERVQDAAHRLEVEVPETAVVDEAQFALMGIPVERRAEARAAIDRQMAQFRLPSGLFHLPLAFLLFTARSP